MQIEQSMLGGLVFYRSPRRKRPRLGVTIAAFVVLAAASGMIANQVFSHAAESAAPRGPLSYLPR